MNLEAAQDRERALAVACPYCNAQPGDPCVRKGTDAVLVGPPAHTNRIDAAGVQHAPMDSREYTGGHRG